SAWIRETAVICLPPMTDVATVLLSGEFRTHPEARGCEAGFPRLEILADGRGVASISARNPGAWEARIPLDPVHARRGSVLELRLGGVSLTNALAWLGRVTGLPPIQRFRAQKPNRPLRPSAI